MPKRIAIEAHLSLEELESRYRQAKKPVERTHYQIIWLLSKGLATKEVATVTGYSRSWIYELVWGYNRIGPTTLGDQRNQNQGGIEPLLDDVQQAYLWQALQSPPLEGGLWNGLEEGVRTQESEFRMKNWRRIQTSPNSTPFLKNGALDLPTQRS